MRQVDRFVTYQVDDPRVTFSVVGFVMLLIGLIYPPVAILALLIIAVLIVGP